MCRATLPDIFPVDPGPTAAEEEGGRRAGGVCVCVCVCVCVRQRQRLPTHRRSQLACGAYICRLADSTCV